MHTPSQLVANKLIAAFISAHILSKLSVAWIFVPHPEYVHAYSKAKEVSKWVYIMEDSFVAAARHVIAHIYSPKENKDLQ